LCDNFLIHIVQMLLAKHHMLSWPTASQEFQSPYGAHFYHFFLLLQYWQNANTKFIFKSLTQQNYLCYKNIPSLLATILICHHKYKMLKIRWNMGEIIISSPNKTNILLQLIENLFYNFCLHGIKTVFMHITTAQFKSWCKKYYM